METLSLTVLWLDRLHRRRVWCWNEMIRFPSPSNQKWFPQLEMNILRAAQTGVSLTMKYWDLTWWRLPHDWRVFSIYQWDSVRFQSLIGSPTAGSSRLSGVKVMMRRLWDVLWDYLSRSGAGWLPLAPGQALTGPRLTRSPPPVVWAAVNTHRPEWDIRTLHLGLCIHQNISWGKWPSSSPPDPRIKTLLYNHHLSAGLAAVVARQCAPPLDTVLYTLVVPGDKSW